MKTVSVEEAADLKKNPVSRGRFGIEKAEVQV